MLSGLKRIGGPPSPIVGATQDDISALRDEIEQLRAERAASTVAPAPSADVADLRTELAQLRRAVSDSHVPTEVVAAEPVLFNPTKVWAPTPDPGTDRTALIIGGLAVAALFLLLARKA